MATSNESTLQVSKDYIFNPKTNKYVFQTEKKFGRNLVFSKDKIDTIIKLYSNFDKQPATAGEIALKMGIPKETIVHILRVLKITHDALPFSKEKIEEVEEDVLVEEMANSKSFNIQQKFEKRDWKQTQEDAEKWRELQYNVIQPIERKLSNWNPPKYIPLKKKVTKGKVDIICALSDLHVGEFTNSEKLFHGRDYNSQIAEKIINDYCENVISDLKEKNQSVDTAYLCVLGDFLHSAFNGTTAQGTKLTSDLINEELFEKGLNILTKFISRFNEAFPKVVVKVQRGNHEGVVASYIGYALQQYFRLDKAIDIEVVKSWATIFKVKKLAVLAFHGGSDTLKHANVPRQDGQMRSYIQELFLAKQKDIADCTDRIVISGHTHAFTHKDMGSFDFYVMGTSVIGDCYADTMNFPRSKARQNCLIIKDSKVAETLHYYF